MKKRTKILSLILALVLVVSSIVTISIVSSSAESFTDEYGIEWTVVENKPGWAIKPTNKSDISGSVIIPEEYNGEPINMITNQAFQSCKELTSVILPKNLKYINAYAFSGCTGLTEIDIPDNVTEITRYAFGGCTQLVNVNFGNGVQIIGNSAFKDCTSLKSIVIPDSVKTLGGFQGCTGLTEIDIPDSVTEIYGSTFQDCTSLKSIDIPNSVTKIGTSTFKGCTQLSNIALPNGVIAISNNMFEGCANLTEVDIPNSVTTIGEKAFYNCSSLANITIPNTVTDNIYKNTFQNTAWYDNQPEGLLSIDHILLGYKGTKPVGDIIIPEGITVLAQRAFEGCTGITSVTLPSTLRSVSPYAFYGCTGLTEIDIPDSVTEIGTYAFKGCTKLSDVDFGNGVQIIGSNAFENCTSLKSIVIPDSVTEVGYVAFKGCTQLADIAISANTKYAFSTFINTAWWNNQSNGLVYNNNVLVGYKGDKPSGNITVADGTVSIASSAFVNCSDITSVVIPDSVTIIYDTAFSGCTKLADVDFGNGVQIIGSNAFENCTSLKSIVIPDSVTEVGNNAFSVNVDSYTSNLTDVTLGKNIKTLGDAVFYGTKITTINLPDGLTEIGDLAFRSCSKLIEIKIPDSVKTIGSNAFAKCTKLADVDFGNGVQIIEEAAFLDCRSLKSIVIPDSVTKIGLSAFEWCNGVENIILPNSLKTVEAGAFSDCGLIENFTMNCSFDVLSGSTFYNDTFLNVTLGDEIDSLGNEFSNMDSLENIVIPDSVTNIKDTAFVGSPNVTITTTSNSTAHQFADKNNIPVKVIDSVNTVDPVNFEVTCDKTGYEFTVYKVADLETTTDPYEVRYDSLIDSVDDEIFNGDSEGLLAGLDEVPSSELLEVVGTYNTDTDGASKLFENLEPGIYYVRATDFPANVYWVQNSVFALPYYNAQEGWIYKIDPIPLATKVDESDPEIVKTITNSTKDNVNFTDVSLGDTVNFEIEASRVGSANVVESKDFKLNSYVVSDIMESGLTLNQDSFVVTLEDLDGNTIATLANTTDYIVNIVANEGVDTTFTVSLTPEYLQETEFYSSANVVIAYSAVLNEYSTREFDGNYNTAANLTYSNKTDVSATVDGNTVYAYTFGIEVNKYDDAGTPLAGSQFALYLNEDDAKAKKNEIATGTSADDGKVEFLTTNKDIIKLASGTYYIVETQATESYNRYTDVIPVTINVEYGETEANGTYILSAPENGIQIVEVKNSKVLIPNTGGDGALYRYLIAAAFLMLAITFVVLKKRNSKKGIAEN